MPIPSLQLKKKDLSHAEKQRVWSRGLQEVLQYTDTSFALCLHHAHPFVAAGERGPVSCREAEGLVTELWSPRFVTSNTVILIVLSVVTCDCCKPMNNCRNWVFSHSGFEVGCQPFSCPCSLNVMHCRKEIYGTCSSKESCDCCNSIKICRESGFRCF